MINQNLLSNIKEFFELNEVNYPFEDYLNNLIEIGFNIEKYGFKPNDITIQPKVVEKIIEKKIYLNDDSKISEIEEQTSSLKKEIKILKLDIIEKEKMIKLFEEKFNYINNLVENYVEESDLYGEENEILKKLKNEIKRK